MCCRFSATERFAPLQAYIDYYDFWVTSHMATYVHKYGAQVPLVVGDHSTHTIDIFRGGDLRIPGFRYSNTTPPSGSGVPDHNVLKSYSTPLLLKQLIPHVKLIVIMRDPVDRIFSLYRMHEAHSREDFHAGVLDGIRFWHACMAERRAIAECLYFKLKPEGYENSAGCKWSTRAIGSLRRGLYHYYLAEWLSVFKREQLLVLNFNAWAKNNTDILNNRIFPFLELPRLSGFNEMNMVTRHHIGVSRSRPKSDGSYVKSWRQGDMLPETRKILQEFYEPHNRKLAQLLNDNSFMWIYPKL